MKDRKPFEINSIITVYNIAQVFLNLYTGVGVSLQIFLNTFLTFKRLILQGIIGTFMTENFNIFCIPAPWGDYSKAGLFLRHISHAYYLIKIVDLLDTVFFILRKKNNQVTFLHIYHHAMMMFGSYLYIKFMSGGGHGIMLGWYDF